MKIERHHRVELGFTLVELLVVVTIIVILLSLVLPAALALRESAKRKEAAVQAQMLVQAVVAYRAAYGKWPGQTQDTTDTTYTDSAAVIAALTNNPILNPRLLQFIEIPTEALQNGAYVDPWKRSFIIAMDENADGAVQLSLPPEFGSTLVFDIPNQTAAVASGGPDPAKESKRIYSWAP